MQLIPYSFQSDVLPVEPSGLPAPGVVHGVFITVPPDYDFILSKIGQWFAGWPEVSIVCDGVSDKHGLGYIMMEWYECEIDRLFLSILRDEETVADYSTYVRDVEVM